MPIRLLPKSDVAKAKALDRQKEVQEGMKLAKRVDNLREVAAREEESLTKFRVNTISLLKKEIDEKVTERDFLEDTNKVLREERMRLEAPLDLTQAWDRVKNEQEAVEEWREDVLLREISLTERENNVRDTEKGFKGREQEIRNNEDWTRQALTKAENDSNVARDAVKEAEETKMRIKHQERQQNVVVAQKNQEIATIEEGLSFREEEVEKDKADIINQRKFLADQRATLERGFAELRRKQS